MFKRKKRLSPSDPEFTERFHALMNDPEFMAQAEKRRENLENMLNTPMRWYHKLPYWIVFGLIIYGISKLFGIV
jgi:hypothetical protein